MTKKLIVVMIDGVSADYVLNHQARLPHLARLIADGLYVERLSSDVPGTSLPGRSSIVTGLPASQHGVYGNVIWDGMFRYANPDDLRGESINRQALKAGKDVAVMGYGMIRPEDATVFQHAWWAGEMIQRARDQAPIPADEAWLRTVRHKDNSGRLRVLAEQGLAAGIPDAYAGDRAHYFASELAGDQIMMQWTAGLASSEQLPDLILTEILTPDSVQHVSGYESDFAHWSIAYADAILGSLLTVLHRSPNPYNLLVLSDHGHGPVHTAIHAERILPGVKLSSECCFLYVHTESQAQLTEIQARLAEHGILKHSSEHLPAEVQSEVVSFLAPEGHSFESAQANSTGLSNPPRYPSTHGFPPGTAADDRFAVFYGPDIQRGNYARATAEQIAPSMAALLGLELKRYPAKPLF